MNLIALAGRAGSGKDTVAAYIRDLAGYQRIGFADPLKRIAIQLYDLDPSDVDNRDRKETVIPEWGLSPRQMLQRLGTEVCRSVHPETWTRALIRTIYKYPKVPGWVVTDCRFMNEVSLVRSEGGRVFWIDRQTAPVSAHASESSVTASDCDLVIDNNGTLDDLKREVIRAMKS